MPFPVKITMYEERPPEASVRQWREITREAHLEMGLHWHRVMLPRHFLPGARETYGYKPRTKKYSIRKNKAYAKGKAVAASNTDLVYSGNMRQLLTSLATVRGFPSRVTIQMTGPRYVTMRVFQSNQPDKTAEVTAVTSDEAQRLSTLLHNRVTERLDALREPKTTIF